MNFNLINYAIGATSFAGIKNNLVATVAPAITNDSSQGYSVGSVWINSTSNTIYIATNIGVGAANWVATTGGGGTLTQNNFAAIVDPALTNDSSGGYAVGSHWINTTNDTVFVCTDSTMNLAVWSEVTNQLDAKNNLTAIATPTPSDNTTLGYSVGSVWIDNITDSAWIAISASPLTAVWKELTNVTTPKSNSAIVDPINTDDISGGYSVGSIWTNTATRISFVNVYAATLSAVWTRITAVKNNFIGAVPPTSTDDFAAGYEIGSLWLDTINTDTYICIDSTNSNAFWSRINSNVKNFYTALAAPTATDDSGAGFDLGSIWIVSSNQNAFICVDNLLNNSIWVEITKPILHNFTAITPPGVADGILLGYTPGSQWLDTVANTFYINSVNTIGAAAWVNISFPALGVGKLTNNYIAVLNPAPSNNLINGYGVGSFWLNTSSSILYVCISSTDTSASWVPMNGSGGGGAVSSVNSQTGVVTLTAVSVGAEPTLSNPSANGMILSSTTAGARSWVATSAKTNAIAIVDPAISNDSSVLQGYSVGSIWVNTVSNTPFICVDSTIGAAVWVQNSSVAVPKFGITPPFVTMDGVSGFAAGTIYTNTAANRSYVSASATTGAAVWLELTNNKINLAAIVDPTTSNDGSNAQGYSVGSTWLNTVTNQYFSCTSATVGSAVWRFVADHIQHNMTATTNPVVTNDITQGYMNGSVWFNTSAPNVFINTDNTLNSAVWTQITSAAGAIDNLAAIIAPSASNDISQGYTPSSHWYDTLTQNLYINVSNASGAAVWTLVSDTKKNNFIATVAPSPTDDSHLQYELGSIWYDTTGKDLYLCVSTTINAAVWVSISSIKHNLIAAVDPTATDDSTSLYEVGSQWVNVTLNNSFICVDATATSAIWNQMDNAKNNLVAILPPAVANDSSQGYSIGSAWYDVTGSDLYVASSVSTGAAVWVKVSDHLKNNYTATTNPSGVNNSTQGYAVGSQWLNVTLGQFYVNINSAGVAVWHQIDSQGHPLATVISPVSTDATGAVGVSTSAARQDHMHPADGVSADVGNATVVGTDGLHFTPSTTLDGNTTHITRADAIAAVSPTVGEVASPINGDTAVIRLTDGKMEYWSNNGTTWSLNFTQTPSATPLATAISPVSTDATGAVGVSTNVARQDHMHPADGVSADVGNRLSVGSDGLHLLNDETYTHVIVDSAGAWGLASGGFYTITIPATTHGVATPRFIGAYETISGSNYDVIPSSISINNTTGDVEIAVIEIPDGRFTGSIQIR